jgi:hypothetical protein
MDAVSAPVRVQLSRAKGWRMPPNTMSVARPGPWGNPFKVGAAIESGYATAETAQAFVVECFGDWLGPTQSGRDWWQGPESDRRKKFFAEEIGQLRGKNLACWCKLGSPCHADVLLKLANPLPADGPLEGQERNEAADNGLNAK